MRIASGTGTQRRPRNLDADVVDGRRRSRRSAPLVRLRAMAFALDFRRWRAASGSEIQLCDSHRVVLPGAHSPLKMGWVISESFLTRWIRLARTYLRTRPDDMTSYP